VGNTNQLLRMFIVFSTITFSMDYVFHVLAGTRYMYFNLEDVCYTSRHNKLMMVAAAGLVVYIGMSFNSMCGDFCRSCASL